jgi:hypothetical protein
MVELVDDLSKKPVKKEANEASSGRLPLNFMAMTNSRHPTVHLFFLAFCVDDVQIYHPSPD